MKYLSCWIKSFDLIFLFMDLPKRINKGNTVLGIVLFNAFNVFMSFKSNFCMLNSPLKQAKLSKNHKVYNG